MRFVKPNEAAGNAPGGFIGTPHSRDWLKEWIENKGRWVLLKCGHIEDLNDRSMTIIKAFKGTEVGCNECNLFSPIVKTLKRKTPPVVQPEEPLF